ncbi:MAG TPA: RagB/SusD family nutrient uptake outer membrane protein [Bacteroidales bacterium]|nr:RagB/SusD family nutrient uptake outer membrane protein [Bacteroidales bacterium]
MNIMKNKIFYRLFWLLIIPVMIFTSCDEKLDLKPKQSIDAGTTLTTPENIFATLVGAYLQARDADIFGSTFNEYSELLAASTDMVFLGTYDQPREIINKEIAVTNSYIRNTWIEAYELINTCNTLIDPEIQAVLDPADAEMVEGEAKFLRGWVLFEMTRLFGLPYEPGQSNSQLGVPIVTTPTKDVSHAIKVERNTVDQCYTQVLNDLIDARDLLLEDNDVYATTYAASAVLARVYLQMSDFTNAATEANRVIESGYYSLTEAPLDAFNNNAATTEDIFALQNNVASNTSWLTVMYASLNGMGRGDYDIQQVFLDTFDPADLRGMYQGEAEMEDSYTITNITKMYYYGVGAILNNGGINTSKWGDYYANIPLIRLAEMYLVRAEANFESTGPQVGPNTPLQDINIIRNRALAPEITGPITQDQIRQERYWELCWEGHRLHDLKRWELDIEPGLAYDAGNLILPIPFREMEANDLLVQNSWYVSK